MVKHKEGLCSCSGSSRAEEPLFRVRVCMRRVHCDERARAYVCVSARRRVRWLHRRLRHLFALPPRFRLLSRGHLLPRDEPLALLHPDDLVEVVPVHTETDATAVTGTDTVDSLGAVTVDDTVACELSSSNVHLPSLVHLPICSPSPIRSPSADRSVSPYQRDELTESKRRALLMLEHLAGDVTPPHAAALPQAAPPPHAATRPRRRRVRRRRRVPSACLQDNETASAVPTVPEHNVDVGVIENEKSMAVSDVRPAEAARTALREPDVISVLRNALSPRAPRHVRPIVDVTPGQPVTSHTALEILA